MKEKLGKLMNVPIHYTLVVASVLLILAVSVIQGTISTGFAIGVLIVGTLFILQMSIGSVVLKSIFSIFSITYLTSIYTSAVMELQGKIIEPFLLTIAVIAMFLAQTYSNKNVNFNLRSRPLWSFILALILVSVKLSMILSNYSFILTELIGFYLFIIFTILWRLWTNKSKKTKVNSPTVIEVKEDDKFKMIFIEEELDLKNNKWANYKNENAYPYLFSEAILANEKKLKLVIISKESTDRYYDIRKIRINKSKEIPYMYIKAKDETYLQDALMRFYNEEN